jgi:two-component system chemotaxis response regulator CheY
MSASAADAQRTDPEPPTVLVADDAAQVRKALCTILREHGFRVLEAENGYDAVARYVEYRPDVVLLDVNLPQLNGLGALAAIRQHDAEARVIMVTAFGQHGTVHEAIRAGVRDVVVKPFEVARVVEAVRKLADEPSHD